MKNLFGGVYNNKKVLVTGHSGFKGSWLTYWLSKLGAKTAGYSLKPETYPNHFDLLDQQIDSTFADIRDHESLDYTIKTFNPDIIFHLAAQPLVRRSYKNPFETYEINILGTLKLFEICNKYGIKAIVNITSDKVYDNKEWFWGYRENDSLGGYDPYSSSKACVEIMSESFRKSFFNINDYKINHNTLLATCRAGNVIGGGDWAEDRLIPDLMKKVSKGEKTLIRNPKATRPWQHVLEPLSGYLCIGEQLLIENRLFADSWNFGPKNHENYNVEQAINGIKKYWNQIKYVVSEDLESPHEAGLLKLDCSKAIGLLGWESVWDASITFKNTANWYKSYYEENLILTQNDLQDYVFDAKKAKLPWAGD